MIRIPKASRRRTLHPAFPAAFLIASLVAFPAAAQDESEENPGLTAAQLLADALLFNCDVAVTMPEGETDPWTTTVRKITIPGRTVTVGLEGDGSRLEVNFTLYPVDEGGLFLVAKSETWTDQGYSSDLSSMRIAYHDEVYFYPLGRAEDDAVGNPVEIRMAIGIVPYLETLDEDERASLESAFDSSALFDLTGEGG